MSIPAFFTHTGSAGTCWAFSTVQNIESQWVLKGMNLTEFSVEQIVECDGSEDVDKYIYTTK